MSKLTVEEALALVKSRRKQWLLAGQTEVNGVMCPTYQCGACTSHFTTLTSPEAKLPSNCPKCLIGLTPSN